MQRVWQTIGIEQDMSEYAIYCDDFKSVPTDGAECRIAVDTQGAECRKCDHADCYRHGMTKAQATADNRRLANCWDESPPGWRAHGPDVLNGISE